MFIITPGERNVKEIKKESGELKVSASHNGFSLSKSLTNIVTAHMLEAASRFGYLLLPSFERDIYPDREFHSPLRRALQRTLLTSSGRVGQDMRQFGQL
jgi:hypothetical protein